MSIMSRSAWTLLGVLLLPILCSPVLEPDGDPGLLEVQLESDGFPHEDVRIVTRLEHSLQLLQLPLTEVGAGPAPLVILTLRI